MADSEDDASTDGSSSQHEIVDVDTSCDSASDDDDDESDAESLPYEEFEVHSPQEIGNLFVDFYKFLTTLHYEPSDLTIPPAEGWPIIDREYVNHKSDFAREVLRHLPYLRSGPSFHYKSHIVRHAEDDYGKHRLDYEEDFGFYATDAENAHGESRDPGDVSSEDVLLIAQGHESYGRSFYLLTREAQIVEDMIRADTLDAVELKDFFGTMKEQYRTLQLIPAPGRVTIETDALPDVVDREISLEEIEKQTEEWGTTLDIQYLQQLYRRNGWPDAFDKQRTWMEIDDLMKKIEDTRSYWETEGDI